MSTYQNCPFCGKDIEPVRDNEIPSLFTSGDGFLKYHFVCNSCNEAKLNGGSTTGECIECGKGDVEYAYAEPTVTLTEKDVDIQGGVKGGILCEDDFNALREQ